MKRYLVILLLSGCTTYPEYVGVDYPTKCPIYTPTMPPLIDVNTQPLQQALSESHYRAAEIQQFANAASNRNGLSQALLNFQTANRNLNAILQNPWNGFYMLRNN